MRYIKMNSFAAWKNRIIRCLFRGAVDLERVSHRLECGCEYTVVRFAVFDCYTKYIYIDRICKNCKKVLKKEGIK